MDGFGWIWRFPRIFGSQIILHFRTPMALWWLAHFPMPGTIRWRASSPGTSSTERSGRSANGTRRSWRTTPSSASRRDAIGSMVGKCPSVWWPEKPRRRRGDGWDLGWKDLLTWYSLYLYIYIYIFTSICVLELWTFDIGLNSLGWSFLGTLRELHWCCSDIFRVMCWPENRSRWPNKANGICFGSHGFMVGVMLMQ